MKYSVFLAASGAPDGSATRRAFKWYLQQIPRKETLSTFIAMYYRPAHGGWILPDAVLPAPLAALAEALQ